MDMDFRELVKQARKGAIVPVHKTVDAKIDIVDYFAKLSDYGREENCILLESADVVPKYGEQSLGSAEPCLKLVGKGADFKITALNALGEKFIEFLKGDLDFCSSLKVSKKEISGKLDVEKGKVVSEEERLQLKTHADIIRAIAFKFKPTLKPFGPYAGLFGCISYDFIDQFEQLPKNKKDVLKDPDYELYFLDNLFLYSHKEGKITFIANALIMNEEREKLFEECMKKIESYEKALNAGIPKKQNFKFKKIISATDTSKSEFIATVKKLKGHILKGDIFQAVPSRTMVSDYNAEPLDIYKELRSLNPSPYMFYLHNSDGILLGSSPEMFLRVQGNAEKTVEIRPIAGTKPRGFVGGKLDKDLDSRFEAELKGDKKELAEHTMLIDLARNDVARVSKAGSRHVDEPYIVEKYSHVQHLVSNVSGTLKPGLDCLHAYLASMNMGTLTGAPKVKAMELLRLYEQNKRGFYGGAVAYITPSGELDSCIVIRSARLKGGKAYVRAGAGIVYDSVPEKEFEETEKKARACLKAIEIASGVEKR